MQTLIVIVEVIQNVTISLKYFTRHLITDTLHYSLHISVWLQICNMGHSIIIGLDLASYSHLSHKHSLYFLIRG